MGANQPVSFLPRARGPFPHLWHRCFCPSNIGALLYVPPKLGSRKSSSRSTESVAFLVHRSVCR